MLPSPASSPDLKAATRIRRKPPPYAPPSSDERYPAPDPDDPFAPLWVLRNRTSSALGHAPPSTRTADRRHSMSFSSNSPFAGSPCATPSLGGGGGARRAHYIPHSQAPSPAPSAPQLFPRLGGSRPSTPDFGAYMRSAHAYMGDSSSTVGVSDASSASEMRFRPNFAFLAAAVRPSTPPARAVAPVHTQALAPKGRVSADAARPRMGLAFPRRARTRLRRRQRKWTRLRPRKWSARRQRG